MVIDENNNYVVHSIGGIERKYDLDEMDNEIINQLKDESNYEIEFLNFADDCTVTMKPVMNKNDLNDKSLHMYRLNMQMALDSFLDWTKYHQLIVGYAKCSTITFCNKNKFTAYVYSIENEKLELIHASNHAPQNCKHNKKLEYTDVNEQLDTKYFEKLIENNGDSDLENLDFNGNKIQNYKKQYNINKDKNIKSIMVNPNELPEHIRILGIHFDPKMYFNNHIEIVLKKAEKKLYNLQKMAKCDKYQFNQFTIFKFAEAVIRPKLEFGQEIVSASSKFKEIEKFQIRVAKLALNLKRDTPTIYVKELLNLKTMKQKLEESQVKLWHKYKRSPSNITRYYTFNHWKKYIELNGGNVNYNRNLRNKSKNLNENFNINSNIFNHVSKSTLSRAYNVIRKIRKPSQNIFDNKIPSILKPPPIYTEIFPSNIILNKVQQVGHNEMDELNNYVFYTDGSCIPNPGPGGSAYYSPNFYEDSRIDIIDHDTTINYCELYAIDMILNDYLEQNIIDLKRNIKIFTDSNFVMNILDMNNYIDYDYYYPILMNIFEKMNRITVKIIFQKIPSHNNIHGNEMADGMAKEAAKLAKKCKKRESNIINYDMSKNPINVDISKDLIWLRKYQKKQRIKEWNDRNEKWLKCQLDENIYQGDMLFHKYICNYNRNDRNNINNNNSNNNNNIRYKSNVFKNQMKNLTKFEAKIINCLRTEHVNLNDYKYFRFKDEDSNFGNCIYCDVKETVNHFLTQCGGCHNMQEMKYNSFKVRFDGIRNILRNRLKRIDRFFKNNSHFTSENILFPHIWQMKLNKKMENYHVKKRSQERRQIYILKEVVNFVISSKRFVKEKYGI